MSFSKRYIDIEFQLGTGSFGQSLGDTVRLSGLRSSATIQSYSGVAAQGQLSLRLSGAPLDVINKLTQIGVIGGEIRNNQVRIFAGTDLNALTLVYNGWISSAYGEFNSAPDVAMNLVAFNALIPALRPVAGTSYQGTIDIATVLQNLAGEANLGFFNAGVTALFSDPHFSGSSLDKIRAAVSAADINAKIENQILTIWPKGESVQSEEIAISPDTGMVGYPAFSGNGIVITTEFSQTATVGAIMAVISSLPVANGKWSITTITHSLETESPGGAWFTRLEGVPALAQQ